MTGGLFDTATLTPGQAFGLVLLGMGLGVFVGAYALLWWLTRRDHAPVRLPDRLHHRIDDEPPTARIEPPNVHDLPRKDIR